MNTVGTMDVVDAVDVVDSWDHDGDCPFEVASRNEIIAYSISSALAGSLSITGSLMIIYILSRDGWNRLSNTRDRLVLGISVIDVFNSIATGASILPTPQETNCSIGKGNLTTCAIQGFLIQIGLAAPSYNAMISLYYLMTIRYGITRKTISQKYECFMHAFAIAPYLSTAIIGLVGDMYFNEAAYCWFGDICNSLSNCPSGNVWGRGRGLVIATMVLAGSCSTATVFCMVFISRTLHERNLSMSRFVFQRTSTTGTMIPNDRRLNNIEFAEVESAKQAYLYAAAFTLTYIWPLCALIAQNITTDALGVPSWVAFYIAGFFIPLQGFWNFFIYVRPIVAKVRRDENDDSISFRAALGMTIFQTEVTHASENQFEEDPPKRRGSILSQNDIGCGDESSIDSDLHAEV